MPSSSWWREKRNDRSARNYEALGSGCGVAPGTRKDEGHFWTGPPGCQDIFRCESALDAISCCQLHPQRIRISTSGVRAKVWT